jgi:hypothetical protein
MEHVVVERDFLSGRIHTEGTDVPGNQIAVYAAGILVDTRIN